MGTEVGDRLAVPCSRDRPRRAGEAGCPGGLPGGGHRRHRLRRRRTFWRRCGRAGVRPRVLVRDPGAAAGAPGRRRGCDLAGILKTAAALTRLCAGAARSSTWPGWCGHPTRRRSTRPTGSERRELVAALEDAAPGARLVHVSSLAAAGPSPDPAGRDPADEPRPISAYGRSKLAGEREAMRLWRPVGDPAAAGDLRSARHRHPAVLPAGRAGRGAASRRRALRDDRVYVADVVRAILAAAAGRGDGRRSLHLGEPTPRSTGRADRAAWLRRGRAGAGRSSCRPWCAARSRAWSATCCSAWGSASVALTSRQGGRAAGPALDRPHRRARSTPSA